MIGGELCIPAKTVNDHWKPIWLYNIHLIDQWNIWYVLGRQRGCW